MYIRHACNNIVKKENMNLNESGQEYIEGLGGKKGKREIL